MLKQSTKNDSSQFKEIHQDIQFLLSNIRARENGLIFFLQRFITECRSREQFTIFKEEFLQKQKIYANQVSRILARHEVDQQSQIYMQQYAKQFWTKIRTIIKVSLDRLIMLKLLNDKILNRYDEIIELVKNNFDQQKSVQQFSCVQNLLKKRNLDALIYSRNQFSSPNSETKIAKNRSESAFKHSKFSPKPTNLIQDIQSNQILNLPGVLKFEESNDKNMEVRMKSLNRYRKKKILMQNKNTIKNQQKNYKKIFKSVDKIQKCLQGAMECTIQTNIDKKKTLKQNQMQIYDTLFNKNISNHKMISKFLYGACGITQLLIKRKNVKTKKLLSNKTDKNIRETKDLEKKNKSRHQRQSKQIDKQKDKPKEKEKENKDKEKQKQKQKQKQTRQRPQTSLPAQIKSIFEEEKKKLIQTTLLFQDKKGIKYRRKIAARIQKYAKLIKIAV